MKKSILFCCYGLGIGGIEKCMINLLNALDTTKYDIDVLPMNPEYALRDALCADVTLLDPFDYVMNPMDTVSALKTRKAGLLAYGKYALYRIINKWGRKPWQLFRAPEKVYDIAIAYAHTGYVPYYVIDKVRAKRKYMWHHEGRYIKDARYPLDREYYPEFDAIIPVSQDDRQILVDAFPALEAKFQVLYNVVDKNEICRKSADPVDYCTDSAVLKLTTVGRLTHQKGPDILLEVAKKLKAHGISFLWYWVGSGDMVDYLKNEAIANGIQDNIILLGNQNNPYPYIARCDIYVQPSYYEAYCTTTIEAQVLMKPIVVTDVCGMREQFTDGVDGILVPVEPEAIFREILRLWNEPSAREALTQVLRQKMQTDDGILNSYYQLFDE